ncbi:MAG: hypothetical protein NTZ32_24640 [Planctomycetales bacterium]|nr:hypothetical protein [Planctomycetales bacterium]
MSSIVRSKSGLLCGIALLAVTVLASGCKPKAPATGAGAAAGAAATGEEGAQVAPSKKAPGGIVPINREPKSIEGNWVMVVTMQGRDQYIWVVKLVRDADGKFSGSIIDSTKDKMAPEVTSTIVEDQTVKLGIKNSQGTINFEGRFDGKVIRGTLSSGPQEVYLGRMLSTDVSSLTGYAADAGPPASDIFEKAFKAMKEQPNPKVIMTIAHEYPTSPVSFEAMSMLLQVSTRFEITNEDVLAMIGELLRCAEPWGPKIVAKTELQCGEHLIASRRLSEEGLKHLARAEELSGDSTAEFQQYIATLRDAAAVQMSLEKITSVAEANRAEAYLELKELLKKQPFNSEILIALAGHAQVTQQSDDAILYYSDIVALPLLEQFLISKRAGQPAGDPTPSDELKKVWTERHGDDKGLEAHLATVHHTKLDALINEVREKATVATDADPKTALGDHAVLVELFTGALCPPCVAADLGVTALSRQYPAAEVVTLRYHQHIPGPDGMTNQDSEDRFAFYEAGGTPTVTIDGMVVDSKQFPYTGPLQFTKSAYNNLRQFVDLRRKQSTPIRLQLEASVKDGELSINASATGFTEEELPSLRLRLALAEEVVASRAPNGIRQHEMVVREMPGGARGIAPKKGELKYSYTMPITDLQLHLDEYIQRFESGNKIDLPAEMKPPVRGSLQLVGWVQVQGDKATEGQVPPKLILQTAIVPVTGFVAPTAPVPTAIPKDEAATKSSAAPAESTVKPPAPALPE